MKKKKNDQAGTQAMSRRYSSKEENGIFRTLHDLTLTYCWVRDICKQLPTMKRFLTYPSPEPYSLQLIWPIAPPPPIGAVTWRGGGDEEGNDLRI